MLPVIATGVQDSTIQGKVFYDTMDEMHLNLHELSPLGKLYLAANGSIIETSEDRAQLTAKDIQRILEYELQPYLRKGLLKEQIADFTIQCAPKLYYIVDSPGVSHIFWLVSMSCDSDERREMELCIDDQTGRIITIHYDCAQPVYEDWQWDELLVEFYKIYLNRLDLTPQEGFHKPTDCQTSTVFRWGDVEYGDIAILFTVYSHGFDTWII